MYICKLWVVSPFTNCSSSPFKFLVFPSVQNWNIKISEYLDGLLIHHEGFFFSDCFRLTQLKQWIFKCGDIASQCTDCCGAKGKGIWPKKEFKKSIASRQILFFPPKILNTPSGFRRRLSAANTQAIYAISLHSNDWESYYLCVQWSNSIARLKL